MNMEQNKILAAFLVAGITAMFAWFVSHQIYHPHALEENSFKIEVTTAAVADTGSAAPATAEPVDTLMDAANVEAGAKSAKVCMTCHTFEAGGANKVGPNLFGIFGAKHANNAAFTYSDAIKSKTGNWTVAELNEFLWNPKKYAPGTKMTFAGLKKPEDRANVIKWLQTQK